MLLLLLLLLLLRSGCRKDVVFGTTVEYTCFMILLARLYTLFVTYCTGKSDDARSVCCGA